MEPSVTLLKLVSIAAFLFYGLSCLFGKGMEAEFARFGLSRFRRLTGALEVAGALGLITGFLLPVLDIPAAAGLGLLMLLGIITRIRIKDSLVEMLPATLLLVVNVAIVVLRIRSLDQPFG